MWLIIALAIIWGTVLVAWLVSRVLAIIEARNSPTIQYRQSGSDVRKGTMALVFYGQAARHCIGARRRYVSFHQLRTCLPLGLPPLCAKSRQSASQQTAELLIQ
jgi:hypothetical protein